MIYVVTQQILPESKIYKVISIEESLKLLEDLNIVGLDTETMGLDPYTKDLVMIQLGCYDFQVVIDVTTIDPTFYKEYLESDRLFIGWNIKFDLKFLLHQKIVVRRVYDGFLAEKLMWLGYPAGMHSMSLKSAGHEYLGVELDKTIRGKIMWAGLSEDVIEYGANDVKYLEKIMTCQREELEKRDLLVAIEYENASVLWVAYTEYCGVHLDKEKWSYKMALDNITTKVFEDALNDWVIASCNNRGYAFHYLQIEGLTGKSLDKARSSMKGERYPKADVKGEVRGYFEAWKVPVEQTLSSTYIKRNLQGDLFSGFDNKDICTIKWSSPKQVIKLLKDLGFDLRTEDKETGEIKDSTEADIIRKQSHVSTIAYLYVAYKEAQKVLSTYGQNVLNQINERSGRIHTNFNQLGTDTGRLSSGSMDKSSKIKQLNFQNFPADKETRACFTAEKGMKWISMDYSGQENRVLAEVTNDRELIDLFNIGCGDLHSLITKISYPDLTGDCLVEDIKSKFEKLRKKAKSIGFTITYGGDKTTIVKRTDIPEKLATEIYQRCMNRFRGIQKYQNYQRRFVKDNGYIILNNKTRHKARIYDYDILINIGRRISNTPFFWDNYRSYKGKENKLLPKFIRQIICKQFADGMNIDEMVGKHLFEVPTKDATKRKAPVIAFITKVDIYVYSAKYYSTRWSDSYKQSINYPCQGTGAIIFKLASIFLWKYLLEHNLLFKVKLCAPVHDEWNIEVPEDRVDEMAHVLEDCMERAGKFFCKKVDLPISAEIGDHWIH